MTSMPFLPLGRVQMFQVECPHILAFGEIVNPSGPLKLAGLTNLSYSNPPYLLVSSEPDGVHLSEPSNNKIVMDAPFSSTAPLTTVSLTSTGNGSFGGDLAVAGGSSLQGLTVAGQAAFASSLSVAGPLSASSLAVSGAAALQGNTVVGGGLGVAGAVVLQQSLACGPLLAAAATVQGDLVVEGQSTAHNLVVTAGGSLGSLSVTGSSALNTLSTISTASFGAGVDVVSDVLVGGGVVVQGASGLAIPGGSLSLAGVQMAATADTCALSVGGGTALTIDASQNLALPSGSLTVGSINGRSGQSLVLKGADVGGTVHIAGNLVVDGDYETADRVEMKVEDLLVTLAHSQTSPKPDSVADGAGIQIEGNSGFPKSIIWKNNLGLGYDGSTGTVPTCDGLSYFQVQGGSLMLTRTIPAANHLTKSPSSGTWQPDSVETVVSYAFRIDDQENLQIAKVQGTDYSALTGGSYSPIGQTAPVCATYEVATKS